MYKKILGFSIIITCIFFSISCSRTKPHVKKHVIQLDTDTWIKYEHNEETAKIPNIEKALKNKIPFIPREKLIRYNQSNGFIYKKDGEYYIDYIDPKGSGNIITKSLQDAKNLKEDNEKPLRYIKGHSQIIINKDIGKFKYDTHDFYDLKLERGAVTETIDILLKSDGSSNFSFLTLLDGGASYSSIYVFKASGNPYLTNYTIYLKELIADRGYKGILDLDFWGLPKKFYTLDNFQIAKGYKTNLNVQGKFAEKGFVLAGETKSVASGDIKEEAKNSIFGIGFIGPRTNQDNTDNRFPTEEKPFCVTELANLEKDVMWHPKNDKQYISTNNPKIWRKKDSKDIGFVELVGSVKLTLNKKYYDFNIFKYSYLKRLQQSPSFKLKYKADDGRTVQQEDSIEIVFQGVRISKKAIKKDSKEVLFQYHSDLSKTIANAIFFYLSADRKEFGVFKINTEYFDENNPTSGFFKIKFERPKKK